MRVTTVFLLLLITTAVSSCLNDKADEMTGINPCDTTYCAQVIKPIIQTHCMGNNAGCHVFGGSGEGDYANFNQLKEKVNLGIFADRVFITKDMPPSTTPLPALSNADRLLLENWVNAGAQGCY